jgi:hypothetical protein
MLPGGTYGHVTAFANTASASTTAAANRIAKLPLSLSNLHESTPIMRVLAAILICMTSNTTAWTAPWLPPVRDGTWLQNGITQQQRLSAQQNLSDKEINDATLVTSYICAVVDLEKELVQRAALLSKALQDAKKKETRSAQLEGMAQAVPILVPLEKSDFITNGPSCDRALLIVQDYLTKYPEILDQDAAAIVEKALLASYDRSNEP